MLLKAVVIPGKINGLHVHGQLLTAKKKYFTAIQFLFPGIYILKYNWDTHVGAGTLLTAEAVRIVTDLKNPVLDSSIDRGFTKSLWQNYFSDWIQALKV
jgi:hypothetical protein